MARKKSEKRSKKSAFASNLQKMLKDRQMSSAALARAIGVSPSTLHAWLSGSAPTDHEAVLRLARVLDVDFQFLLVGIPANAKYEITDFFEFDPSHSVSGIYSVEFRKLRPRERGRSG